MAGPEEVLKTKITVEADTSGVKQAVEDVKADVGDMADEVESSSNRASGAFESMGTKIDNSTAGVRKFTGAVSGAVGAVTGLIGVFTTLAGLLGTLIVLFKRKAERVEELKASYESVQQQINDYSVDPLLDEYEKFERSANRQIDLLLEEGKLRELAAESLRKQAAEAAELRREADKKAKSDELRKQREREELELVRKRGDIIRQINEATEQQEIELLPTEERIRAEAQRKKDAIRDAFSTIAPDAETISNALDAIDKATQKQLNAEIERQRIADEAQARRDNEADRRSQERVQREIDTLREGLESLTGSEFITTLEAIPKALREVSNGVRRIK